MGFSNFSLIALYKITYSCHINITRKIPQIKNWSPYIQVRLSVVGAQQVSISLFNLIGFVASIGEDRSSAARGFVRKSPVKNRKKSAVF